MGGFNVFLLLLFLFIALNSLNMFFFLSNKGGTVPLDQCQSMLISSKLQRPFQHFLHTNKDKRSKKKKRKQKKKKPRQCLMSLPNAKLINCDKVS